MADDTCDWSPMSEQEDWSDIQPVYNDDVDTGVVSIAYQPAHKEAQAYFKAVQLKKEYSDRVIELTATLIDYNSANYTAWQYRWDCLVALGKDLRDEYEYTQLISDENAKNYQLWNHRRKCALALGKEMAARELEFAATALDYDAKNYHAWAHRQAIVEEFGLWEFEWEYTLQKIEDDVRNNSAWNQRMFVAQKYKAKEQIDFLMCECGFTSQQIRKAPRNESPWQYLRGIFDLHPNSTVEFARSPQVLNICKDVLQSSPSCPQALECLAEVYETLALEAAARGQDSEAGKASGILAELMSHLAVADPIRAHYWNQRSSSLLTAVS